MSAHQKRIIPTSRFKEMIWSKVLTNFPPSLNRESNVSYQEYLALKIFGRDDNGKIKGKGIVQNEIFSKLNKGTEFINLNSKTINAIKDLLRDYLDSKERAEVKHFIEYFEYNCRFVSNKSRNYIDYEGTFNAYFLNSHGNFKNTGLASKINTDYELSIDKTGIALSSKNKSYARKTQLKSSDFFHNNLYVSLNANVPNEAAATESEVITLLFKVPRIREGSIKYLSGIYLALEEDDLRQPIGGVILLIRKEATFDMDSNLVNNEASNSIKNWVFVLSYFRNYNNNNLPIRAITNVKIHRLFEGDYTKINMYDPFVGSWYVYFLIKGESKYFACKSEMIISEDLSVKLNFFGGSGFLGELAYKENSNYYQIYCSQQESNNPFVISFNTVVAEGLPMDQLKAPFICNNPFNSNRPISGYCTMQKCTLNSKPLLKPVILLTIDDLSSIQNSFESISDLSSNESDIIKDLAVTFKMSNL